MAGSAELISSICADEDGKTPEEREAEERARRAGDNVAATAALVAVGIGLAMKKHQTKEEALEESDNDMIQQIYL